MLAPERQPVIAGASIAGALTALRLGQAGVPCTIFESRKIILMAFGEHKAPIIREAVEGPMTDRVPASYLREHSDAALVLDTDAASDIAIEKAVASHDARAIEPGRYTVK